MINRVHTPSMAKTNIMIQVGDGCGLGVFVGGPRACGLAWGWVLVYGGHDGCFGLGVEPLGLMTLASQGIPLLVLGVCLVAS